MQNEYVKIHYFHIRITRLTASFKLPSCRLVALCVSIFNSNNALVYYLFVLSFQFFETSSTLYACVMAAESYFSIKNTVDNLTTAQKERSIFIRQVIYHVVVLSYCIVSTIWLNVTKAYGDTGHWCWIDNPSSKIFWGYVPIWASVLGVVGFLSGWMYLIKTSLPNSETEIYLRPAIYSLLIVLLYIPGSVVRVTELLDISSPYWINVLQWICDPSKGTLNCLTWVITDKAVHREAGLKMASSRLAAVSSSSTSYENCGNHNQSPTNNFNFVSQDDVIKQGANHMVSEALLPHTHRQNEI